MPEKIKIVHVVVSELKIAEYNPRKWDKEAESQLKESIKKFGIVDPLLVNSAEERKNVVIGGHFRLSVIKELGIEEVPVVYINIPDIEKEKELNIRLNKNTGEFDFNLLAKFDEAFLADVGFTSEDIDSIFEEDKVEEQFDLNKELEKLNIEKITVEKGDVYDLDGSKVMCGDSTVEADMLKLCGEDKIDMVMTDPPYILDYLHGKSRQGKATEGFGAKKNRRYLETDVLPDNFTELWMANVHKVQAEDFSIICYENWKNIRTIWNEMEKYWKVKNMLVWHLANRNQGYAGKHKFFSKYDIAMVATSEQHEGLQTEIEEELLENEYNTALFAISGSPQWESYGKGKKYCPTDHIEHLAADEKSSGQGIIFGTKPLEILIPYIKVLTTRDQLVLEPFGGSGSTLIASIKLKRRCFVMEKSPVYTEVIINRWEKFTGKRRIKLS
ncbi:MAG: DNA methyltransferase [Candidatus Pacebacteria bacterium]|nr:DNA methyltransferase [Candidatus Paceibacterota bacterium]